MKMAQLAADNQAKEAKEEQKRLEAERKEQERKRKAEFEEKMRAQEMRSREIAAKISRQAAQQQLLTILEQQEAVLLAKRKEMEGKDLKRKEEMAKRNLESLLQAEDKRQRALQRQGDGGKGPEAQG